jgi:hypothetical protein
VYQFFGLTPSYVAGCCYRHVFGTSIVSIFVSVRRAMKVRLLILFLAVASVRCLGQAGPNDTIRLGGIEVEGQYYPFVFLPECDIRALMPDPAVRERLNKMRRDVFVVYYYATTAGTLFNNINGELEKLPDRKARKAYLKTMNRQLDALFKEPLKNLSVEQGHVLIKLINRQTGNNCYHIIKELKGGFSAVMWQSVGLMFNNNLARNYDPDGRDKELEAIVRELESSAAYRYQLYLQDEMMKKITNK